jgi:hypothetical protein
MKAELKKKWVEALRSGKYKQNRDSLRYEDGFCCLGVLCDVYDNSKWEYDYYRYNDNTKSCTGLRGELLHEVGVNHQENLVLLNDVKRANFDDIADYIERDIPDDES